MPTKKTSDNRHNLPEIDQGLSAPGSRISMIATPIGNLGDLSIRAKSVLQNVEEVWCEDTRHTRQLLHALGIEGKRLKRLDQHTPDSEIIQRVREVEERRQWVGVVTDAGTPGLSDPGASLVKVMTGFPKIRLEPIPGPSAVSTLVSVAGFEGNSFCFQGFFPREDREANELLNQFVSSPFTRNVIFFESPHRIRNTLKVLESWCLKESIEPGFVIAKELTKMHEAVHRGTGVEFLKSLQDQLLDERGEWVFSILLPKKYLKNEPAEVSWDVVIQCLVAAGISAKNAAEIVAVRFSVAKNLAYKRAVELQKNLKDH
jgi:16S rRNA (cytidine1402-2'-O)-methyltransferase